MRVVQNEQMTIGEVDIAKIRFNDKSRDDIPKILKGLQFVYTNVALRIAIFQLLERQVAPRVSKTNGRPGMTLWTILVCGGRCQGSCRKKFDAQAASFSV